MQLTTAILANICNNAQRNYGELVDSIQFVIDNYDLSTVNRVAMFVAQCAHETGRFRYVKEIGNDAYFQKYEFRKDLGNVQPGDGVKFKGRGFIQITGRYNYTQCANAIGIDIVAHPELAETYAVAAQVAGWYWQVKKLNMWCDANNCKKVTKLINGGYNGLPQRLALYNRMKILLKEQV